MNEIAIKWALAQTGISTTEKMVLLVLACSVDEEFKLRQTQRWMADKALLSRQTVNEALKKLEQHGLLSNSGQYVDADDRCINTYVLRVSRHEDGFGKSSRSSKVRAQVQTAGRSQKALAR